ncbi:hypothetical protein MRX96_013065 [Rhipicephalus microplus]
MSSIGSVGRNGGPMANGLPGGVKKDNSSPAVASANGGTANGPLLETTTVKKGLLWQQWDKFFSRWKERYFVLTKDYLACFKKESKVGTSEMGGFLYKVNLADVEGLQWADKKRTGVIALRVGTEGQLLLWTNCGLDDWMFALRDAIGRSKGRREALRKAHTLGPQFYDSGLTKRQALLLQHTLTSSEAQSPSSSVRTSTSCELRSLGERTPTPSLTRRAQRMSGGHRGQRQRRQRGARLRQRGLRHALGALVGPARTTAHGLLQLAHLARTALSRSSPALATVPAGVSGSGAAFPIRAARAQLARSGQRPQRRSPVRRREWGHGLRDARVRLHPSRLAGHPDGAPAQHARQRSLPAIPVVLLRRRQPVVGDRAAYSVQPPDVVPNNHAPRPSASKLMKRAVRAYTHSKSDSSFVLKQSPSQLQGHLAVT